MITLEKSDDFHWKTFFFSYLFNECCLNKGYQLGNEQFKTPWTLIWGSSAVIFNQLKDLIWWWNWPIVFYWSKNSPIPKINAKSLKKHLWFQLKKLSRKFLFNWKKYFLFIDENTAIIRSQQDPSESSTCLSVNLILSLSLFSIVQIIHIDIEEDIKHEFSMDFSRDISLLWISRRCYFTFTFHFTSYVRRTNDLSLSHS